MLGLSGCASALRVAAHRGDVDRIRKLLDKGANVNASSGSEGALGLSVVLPRDVNLPPLAQAVYDRHIEAVKLLLSKGADPNAEGSYEYYRPICVAAENADAGTLKALLDAGANIHARCVEDEHRAGGTAMAIAQNKGYTNIMRMLEKAGAEIISPSGISKQDIASIVQAAVEGAGKAQDKNAGQAQAVESDIDKPNYRSPERPNDFAVVIGLGKYSDIPEAQFGERDGEAVKNHVLALGFPSRNVVFLSGEKAGYKGIEKFVETWLPKNVNETSRVLFYFSGHGAPDPQTGQAYLLPYDGDPNFLENTGYPVKRLYEKLGAINAKEVIVAMDACFSGAGGRSVLAKGARPLVMKVDTAAVPQNLTVFAAASGEQITSTLEDQGHGTFTYYFLKGLSGGAKDGSGAVTRPRASTSTSSPRCRTRPGARTGTRSRSCTRRATGSSSGSDNVLFGLWITRQNLPPKRSRRFFGSQPGSDNVCFPQNLTDAAKRRRVRLTAASLFFVMVSGSFPKRCSFPSIALLELRKIPTPPYIKASEFDV